MPIFIHDKAGYSYQVDVAHRGRGVVYVVRAGEIFVGRAEVNARERKVASVLVVTGFRRRGIASALYDLIERDLCIELQPSRIRLSGGKAFWKARQGLSQSR